MKTSDDNDLKIADYLDNKMTAAEEEAFMQELSENEELRNQYEEELLLRALLSGKDAQQNGDALLFQPADEHINMIETALQKKDKTAVISIFRKYAAVAVVLLLVLGGVVGWIIMSRKTVLHIPIATTNTNDTPKIKDTVSKKDSFGVPQQVQPVVPIAKKTKNKDSLATLPSPQTPSQAPIVKKTEDSDSLNIRSGTLLVNASNINSDSLFSSLYSPYAGSKENDPVELERVYNDLKGGNFSKVITTTEADIQLMGADDRNEVVEQYLHLYKGIAYLAQNKTANAIRELNDAINSAGKTDPQYYSAQWYSALAWLKQKDTGKTAAIAQNLIRSNSAYKSKAEQLLKALNNNGTR